MLENIKVLISEEELDKRIGELAKEIDKDYEGEKVVIVSILKGAVFFTVDLVKKMQTPIELQFMQVSSYEGTQTTHNIKLKKDLDNDIAGKNVIIVEDIIDTGHTLKHLKNYLLSKNPKSLKVAVLTDKKERREAEIEADYVGFEIPNKFVIGYGLDYDQEYRDLPYVGYVES